MKLVYVAVMASFAGAQAPPNLLRQALQGLPGVSVLDAPIDAKSLGDLKDGGYWPPWSMADLDGDGSPDVTAVVVKGLGANREFGVIAVHSRNPGTVQWVVPLGKASITGLTAKQPPNSVLPLFCFYCDSNPYFRWSGTAYEMGLHAIGEEVALAAPQGQTLGVFAEANRNSKMTTRVEQCVKSKIVARAGTSAETRWYMVETANRVRGWIPRSFISTELGECL